MNMNMITIRNSCPLIIIFFLCFIMPIFVFCDEGMHSGPSTQILHSFHEDKNELDGSCIGRDIGISQGKTDTPGIPKFIVEIANNCVSRCGPSNIHLHCGMFASATLVKPTVFQRLSYDDCLVNGGNPLPPGHIIRFTYSNTFPYTLSFKSANFC